MTPRTLPLGTCGTLVAPVVSGCSLFSTGEQQTGARDSLDPARSMTTAGARLATAAGLPREAPTYEITADIDPGTGAVDGTVVASLPVGERADELRVRFFPGLPTFDARARTRRVTVDGRAAEERQDRSVLAVPLPEGHGARVELEIGFGYTLREADPPGLLDAPGGLGVLGSPADVGLLARHPGQVNLGHWFPLWIPDGHSADPEPSGSGDIGNFPAALIRAELTVPDEWTVVDGGVRTGEDTADGRTTVTTEGYGMRDLAVSVVRGFVSKQRRLDGDLAGVTLTAYGPRDAEAELDAVLDETERALRTLSEELVAYPWRELDVVAASLGAGVGGMEWPGATWIESSLFAGGIPGLGGLEDLLGGGALEHLGDLGDLGDLGGELGWMAATLRPWTIAHEVGHEWWHVLVGNDSVLDPVVDEPLAQYAACRVLRAGGQVGPDGALCDTHIVGAYEQMRLLGGADGPAAGRSTGEFASPLQYSGLVYGKAAAFYLALEERFGPAAVAAALAALAAEHAFETVTTEQLRTALDGRLAAGPGEGGRPALGALDGGHSRGRGPGRGRSALRAA